MQTILNDSNSNNLDSSDILHIKQIDFILTKEEKAVAISPSISWIMQHIPAEATVRLSLSVSSLSVYQSPVVILTDVS